MDSYCIAQKIFVFFFSEIIHATIGKKAEIKCKLPFIDESAKWYFVETCYLHQYILGRVLPLFIIKQIFSIVQSNNLCSYQF